MLASDDTRTKLASIWPPNAKVASEAGHQPVSPLKAIRAKCLDCCYDQTAEIRKCTAINCALWPFRAGVHPYTQKARERAGFSEEKEFQAS